MRVMTTLLDHVDRFVLNMIVKERKFKAAGDKHWFDQLSPPELPAHLGPFAKTA